MTLTIRPLQANDRGAWARIWTDYLTFYDSDVTPDIYDLTFARLVDPENLVQNCLVAELEGVAVGIVHYLYHAHNWRLRMCVTCKISTQIHMCAVKALGGP